MVITSFLKYEKFPPLVNHHSDGGGGNDGNAGGDRGGGDWGLHSQDRIPQSPAALTLKSSSFISMNPFQTVV